MTSEWDLQLVVPLWQGGGTADVARGATRLAQMVQPGAAHEARTVSAEDVTVSNANANASDGSVADLDAVVAHLAAATAVLRQVAPRRLLTLGGDCTVDIASIAHLAAVHPQLHVLWIDAHADLNTHESSPSAHAHGMPLRALLGEGHPRLVPATTLAPERCALLGTRSMDPAESNFVQTHRVPLLSSADLQEDPGALPALLRRWVPPAAAVHVHLDLDVLDPRVWPAVAVPEPDGLDVPTLVAVLDAVRGHADVVGVTVTEYAPSTRHDPTTVLPVLQALGVPAQDPPELSNPVGADGAA